MVNVKELDPLTVRIYKVLCRVPFVASIYIRHHTLWNFMLVGATGCFLNWILYEGVFRQLFSFATFIGMAISTLIVFFWNYTWNKLWSLNVFSQLSSLNKDQLRELKVKIDKILQEGEN